MYFLYVTIYKETLEPDYVLDRFFISEYFK